MKKSLAALGCLGVLVLGVLALILAMTLGVITLGAAGANDTQTVASRCQPNAGSDQIPGQYQAAIDEASVESGLPPQFLAAQIELESGWDPEARSHAGAVGLTQFMPSTWEQWGQGDPTDPQAAIRAQGRYMGALYDQMGTHATSEQERVELTLAAYNAGPGAVEEHGGIPPYPETQNYVDTTMSSAQGDFTEDCQGQFIGDVGSGEWTHPLPGASLTSGFGYRGCIAGAECNEYVSIHHGIDFSTGGGAEILAPTDITITATGTNQYQGTYVIARQVEDPGYIFQIHHCQPDSTQVTTDDTVAVGTPLCLEGNTGNSAGAHLHLGINTPDADDTQPTYDHAIDPEPILTATGVL